jgi:GntR family transcriptional regulator
LLCLVTYGADMSAEINRESADPPWVQLAAILRARIASGEITDRLPGERALQQEFGLAPVTIRKAVRALRDEGLVRTTPGMGTYVVKQD